MIYLATQIWLCLLLALLLGLLLGWLLWGRPCRRRLEELRASLGGELDDCRRSLGSARAEAEELKALAAEAAPPEAAPPEAAPPEAAPVPQGFVAADSAGAAKADDRRDDLKKVEGIGPKIEGLLNDDAIFTWSQLAATAVDRLRDILDQAGPRYRVHDPASWPDQARLAAEGRWEELANMQDLLRRGKALAAKALPQGEAHQLLLRQPELLRHLQRQAPWLQDSAVGGSPDW